MFHKIKSITNGKVIFDGDYIDLKACIEEAVRLETQLDFADLSNTCLLNANLDGGSFKHARFAGANLMGANISDAMLDHGDFTNSSLQNCCFCCSSLKNCNFDGAIFGGTDIAGCDISYSSFSTLSALSLNFIDCQAMQECNYIDGKEAVYPFSQPVITINGLPYPIAIFDKHVKIGSQAFNLPNFSLYHSLSGADDHLTFLLKVKELLTENPSYSRKELA